MIDIEELKKLLRNPVRFGSETQEQAKLRHFMERKEAADALTALQSELAAVRQELEEAKRDAERRTDLLDRLRSATANLIKVKGRHNTEIAYQRLLTVCDTVETHYSHIAARKQSS